MTRVLGAALGAVTAVVAVVALAGATQNRPDPPPAARTTQLVLEVRTRGPEPADAARGLVAACRGTVEQSLSDPEPAAGGRWAVAAQPALGPHAARRLAGCLQDATIDRVSARLVSSQDRA